MEITLEKIELVKDRTGVSYKEAKEALENAEGSVVDAIIGIEEKIDEKSNKSMGDTAGDIVDRVKDLVKKGNVSKVSVKNHNGETILNLPVNAGIVATVIAPWAMLVGAIASVGFKCIVEVVKDDGTIIEVSERANEAIGKAVEKGSDIADSAKEKSNQVYDKIKNKNIGETAEDVADKAKDVTDKAKDMAGKAVSRAADAVTTGAKKTSEAASSAADKITDAASEAVKKFNNKEEEEK